MKRSLAFIVFILRSAICSIFFRMCGARSSLVRCEGRLPVLRNRGHIEIGPSFRVRGRIAPCELGASSPKAYLKIGERVFINQGASVTATCHIEIGDDTLIGPFAVIYDTNYHQIDPDHPVQSAPVVIGSNVWLGHGVVVLPGSKIGDHTVVAAGSTVRGDLPPSVLAVGNPAQPIRSLNAPKGWRRNLRPDLLSQWTVTMNST